MCGEKEVTKQIVVLAFVAGLTVLPFTVSGGSRFQLAAPRRYSLAGIVDGFVRVISRFLSDARSVGRT
jgi:hypothetical protein